jgi:hypothetical protein
MLGGELGGLMNIRKAVIPMSRIWRMEVSKPSSLPSCIVALTSNKVLF